MNFEPLHNPTSARLSHACRDMERKNAVQADADTQKEPFRTAFKPDSRLAGVATETGPVWLPGAGLRAGIAFMTKEYAAAGDSYYSLTG